MTEPNQCRVPTLAKLAAAVVGRDINGNILSKIEAEERKRRDSRIDMLHEDEARVISTVKQNFLKKREQVRREYHTRIGQRERSVSGLDRAKMELELSGVPTSTCGNCRRVLNTTKICSVKNCRVNEFCEICDERNTYEECRICKVVVCSNHYFNHYGDCCRKDRLWSRNEIRVGRCLRCGKPIFRCHCTASSGAPQKRKRKGIDNEDGGRNLSIVEATRFATPPKSRVRGGTPKKVRS